MSPERWQGLMQVFGFAANLEVLRALDDAYSEKHRHYHTGEHVDACLCLLDAHAELAARTHEIALALWFHDAIYRPLSGGNEEGSADWAVRFLAANGAATEVIERVRAMILLTRHDAPAQTAGEALLLDIDLSILGADVAGYDAYEAAIRKEYHIVPLPIYRRKRVEVLRGFLERDCIYLTEPFRAERELKARANLARAIAASSG